ncbi:MAG: hypothetical protein CMC84_07245 [Flavobacteriaceae bacterium]|nr:hypothetical protein [Flavobacteriaceae bacterium]|tara:strand:- start:504 stop:1124 length:621 start_codon:yes stop_codon:yes gene_type:complete
MKKILLIFTFLFYCSIYGQYNNRYGNNNEVNVSVETEILIEDKSVEAVREKYRMESIIAKNSRLIKMREARIANWSNKELLGEDLSQIEYIFFMPSKSYNQKITKRLKKNWPNSLPTYVNIRGKFATHKKMPPEIKKYPEKVLYMYIDAKPTNLRSNLENLLYFDTYIQLYDYTGKLIYARGTYDTYYYHAVNALIEDYEFYLDFS